MSNSITDFSSGSLSTPAMDLHVFKPKLDAQSILPALNSYINSANTVSSNPPVSSTGHALDLRPVSPILPDVMANTHSPTTQKSPPEIVHGPPPPEEHSPPTQRGPPEAVHGPPPEEHSPMQEHEDDEEQEGPMQEEPEDDEEQEDPQLVDEVLKIGDGDL